LVIVKKNAMHQQRLFAKMQDSTGSIVVDKFSKKVTQREDLMLQMDNM